MPRKRDHLGLGMRIIRSSRALAAWGETLRREGVRIGLVPTMGALHKGHRSLIRKARLSCDALVVSLFVNPCQFGRGEDLSSYPRRLGADTALCRNEGVDVLFMPSQGVMYPPGYRTSVSVREVTRRWEGEFRPTHFEGVATIVTKLLCLVRPHRAFFGQKDYQQALVVRRLVEDLHLGTHLVMCPTVREQDGLATSSRNEYFSVRQRQAAPILYAALQAGHRAIRNGSRVADRVRREMLKVLRTEPLARLDYLAVCDPQTLEPLTRINAQAILLGAVRIGQVRLLDNLLVRAPRR